MKTYLKELKFEEIIKRLKNGEVAIRESSKLTKYRLIDGILCQTGPCYPNVIGVSISPHDDLYFETEDKFEIKETGLYKTRDGRKVFVSCIDYEFNAPVIGIVQGEDDTAHWYLSGNFESNSKNSDFDIISKWED